MKKSIATLTTMVLMSVSSLAFASSIVVPPRSLTYDCTKGQCDLISSPSQPIADWNALVNGVLAENTVSKFQSPVSTQTGFITLTAVSATSTSVIYNSTNDSTKLVVTAGVPINYEPLPHSGFKDGITCHFNALDTCAYQLIEAAVRK